MNKKIKIFVTLLIVVVVIGIAYFVTTRKNGSSTPTQTADQTVNWKTYQNEKVSFKFPSPWVEKPLLMQGSGYTQEFTDPEKKYNFTFSSTGNYSQITGKPYVNIDEFINMPYKVKAVVIDGKDGRQPLPRAGSENINSVSFFSKDSKFIYTLELKTGNTTLDTSEVDVVNGQKLFAQILSSFKFITPAVIDTSGWTLYTNKTFGYSIKFPTTYQVPPQNEKQKNQLGIDSNIGINKKSDSSDSRVIMINVTSNNEDLSLADYLNKNLKMYGITGPLVSYNFNGYDSLLNKNLPGTNVFIKQDLYIYGIGSPAASSDKEIGDILATFKFVTTAQTDRAVALLQENLSIQYIQRIIANNGTKAYLEPQNEKGDVIEINLIEGNFPDNHTTRIDTFMVNVKTGEILVYDMANNKTISLKDWGMNIIQRFPDYGPQKTATVLVQDGSYYGPPFDPSLYQLEISKSEHLFAKSDLVDLKKYLGKSIKIRYREVRGVVMSEQQLVIVDSAEL